MIRLKEKIADGPVLSLIEAFLKANILDDLEEWTPATGAVRSLIPMGTPANGRSSPTPIASAAASAPSESTRVNAFTRPSTSSMRASDASTNSRELTSPERTKDASSVAGPYSRSVRSRVDN